MFIGDTLYIERHKKLKIKGWKRYTIQTVMERKLEGSINNRQNIH